MNENPCHPPPPADQPPTPAAAKAAAREARRWLNASAGASLVWAGVWTGALAAIMLARPGHAAVLGKTWAVGMFVVALGVHAWVERMRRRGGIPMAKTYTANDDLEKPVGVLEGVVIAAFAIVVGLGLMLFPYDHLPETICGVVPARLFLAVYALGFALLIAWQFVRTYFWEDLLLALCVVAAGAIYAAMTEIGEVLALGTLCGGQLLAGLSLHLRWRRWVHSFPGKSNNASAQETTP